MAQKTDQALKITASWTPRADIAAAMMQTAFGGTAGSLLQYTSGRMQLKHAIKADFSDPDHVIRVTRRAAEVKAALEAMGTLHNFVTSAGAVAHAELEVLPSYQVSGDHEQEAA
jgi:hypothetical protein